MLSSLGKILAALALLASLDGSAGAQEGGHRVRLQLGAGGPTLVAGDWRVSTTMTFGTDSRYDNASTRERAHREEQDELAVRQAGELAPNPLAPLVQHTPLRNGPLGQIIQEPESPGGEEALQIVRQRMQQLSQGEIQHFDLPRGDHPERQLLALLTSRGALVPGPLRHVSELPLHRQQSRVLRVTAQQAFHPRLSLAQPNLELRPRGDHR